MTTIGAFFPQIRAFFPISEKRLGNPQPSPPSSYAPAYKYYNYGHNILRLFDTLPNFLFAASETKRDYQ